MKKTLPLLIICAGLLVSAHSIKPILKTNNATCVGANPCKACKNCKYCKRCAKNGLTCGVCKK